jgi:hypothetical protein
MQADYSVVCLHLYFQGDSIEGSDLWMLCTWRLQIRG